MMFLDFAFVCQAKSKIGVKTNTVKEMPDPNLFNT